MLEEYLQSAEEKQKALRQYYDAGDWKNYSILAHSLKSTSRTIGARELSETAASLEKAGRGEDADTIRRMHGLMMEQYSGVTACLAGVLKGDDPEDDTGDVLEFLPE